jgi:Zn-dependent protease with chaperone function
MRPALLLLCYVVVAAWVLPRPLARLSGAGVSPRLGLTAWLAAMCSVLAAAAAAVGLLARAAIEGWPAFARTVCESVTAGVCPPTVYRSAAYELGLAVTALLGVIAMIVLGWRYGRSLRRASIRTRAHAEAARITGHPVGGHRVEAGNAPFVLDATQPAVYCVPGRPPTIVVTTGALSVLRPEQLAVVLAHERAHLAGRHHLLLAVTRSLAAIAPVVPLFARGTAEVARLAEMRADDVAAQRGGRRTLLTALLAMSAGTPAALAPATWLPVTGGIVADRVRRLAEPPPAVRSACYGLALGALTLAIVVASAVVPALAVPGI